MIHIIQISLQIPFFLSTISRLVDRNVSLCVCKHLGLGDSQMDKRMDAVLQGLKYFEVVFCYVVLSFICITKKLSNFFFNVI